MPACRTRSTVDSSRSSAQYGPGECRVGLEHPAPQCFGRGGPRCSVLVRVSPDRDRFRSCFPLVPRRPHHRPGHSDHLAACPTQKGMRSAWARAAMRWTATTPVVIAFVVAITCTSVASGQTGTVGAEEHRADPGGTQAVSRRLGTTKIPRQECDVRGGDYVAHPDPLPDDLVDCILPPQIRRLGDHLTYLTARQVLASVYDFLYRAGAERPRHGLYSYVLFPVPSRRAERFLEELFKTTSYIDLTETGISYANLNIIYL